MLLRGIGKSLPNLTDLKADAPFDKVPSKHDVSIYSEVIPRYSTRHTKATIKLREHEEADFWHAIETAKDILNNWREPNIFEHSSQLQLENLEMVKECINSLEKTYKNLRSVCQVVPPNIRQTADRYICRLRELEHGFVNQRDLHTSQHSDSYKTSSSSKIAQLNAQAASLRAEIQARKLEETKRLELAYMEAEEKTRRAKFEAELKRKEEELLTQEMETKLKKTETELQVLETDKTEVDVFSTRMSIHDTSNYFNSKMDHNNKTDSVNMKQFLETLSMSVNRNRLPSPEPFVFSGDPLKFTAWRAAFSALIESRNIPARERIYYLQKYLSGEARESIEGLFYFDTEESYQNAWKQLERRYGDDFLISESFRKRLHHWPDIHNSDNKGLRKYADFLSQCAIAIDEIPGLHILDDCHENRKLVEKLPKWSQREWVKKVADSNAYPKFKDFTKFVVNLSDRVNNPVLANMMSKPLSKSTSLRKNFAQAKTLNTGTKTSVQSSKNSTPSRKCIFCKLDNHILNNCRKFRAMDPAERETFIKKNGLCYSCLTFGHVSKDCKEKSKCDSCGKKHPTCLHGDYESLHPVANSSPEVSLSMKSQTIEGRQTGQMTSMVVPVYISSDKNPEEEFMVYALLDSQSDTTFILEETVNKLQTDSMPAKLKIFTMTSCSDVKCRRYTNLSVRGLDSTKKISLPATYSRSFIPTNKNQIATPDVVKNWKHLENLSEKIYPLQDCEVGLLIGFNCPDALAPLEVILGKNTEPFAQRTTLGWSVVGMTLTKNEDNLAPSFFTKKIPDELSTAVHTNEVQFVCRTKVIDITTAEILQALESDFPERKIEEQTVMSQEDMRFLQIMENNIHQDENGYYEMPLPFKTDRPCLPNNKQMAEKRLWCLKKRFQRDQKYFEDYKKFMNDVLAHGDAEEVDEMETSFRWYIPHHGVYHPKKNKIRVVFDCSAQHQETSLNEHLLQGPDLMNSLIGVLYRFREKPVAFISDIERMFHQFRVRTEDRNYLSFLWWKDGNIEDNPTTYRMKVHLFGAASSPGCAIYGLKKLAKDHGREVSDEVVKFLTHDFYVDDGLRSCDTTEQAINLIEEARTVCSKGNIRLHKFLSNNQEVTESIPQTERVKDATSLDLSFSELPVERVLGVQWCVESDQFRFRLTVSEKPFTRRGILSTVASIYDPLGCLAPFILLGKLILQHMCKENCKWDQSLSKELTPQWERWLLELPKFEKLEIPRCYVPNTFGPVVHTELHHFSDASTVGYGQCSYLRLLNNKEEVFCCLVMGKSRVAPSKVTTIPRLELTAAVTSTRISKLLKKEMTYSDVPEYFWTDSKVVLGYIQNDARRFHVFVANRVQEIRSSSQINQWHHIPGDENPADHASRGLFASDLMNSNWFSGPSFLWKHVLSVSDITIHNEIPNEDPEVKKVFINVVTQKTKSVLQRFEKFSDLRQVIRAIAVIKRFLQRHRQPIHELDRQKAEFTIWKLLQEESFPVEMCLLKEKKPLPKGNRLEKLDPFIDDDGLLRVGGRLKRANLIYDVKHPIILPRHGHLVELLIRYCHKCTAHQGRGFTINELRIRGYWILGCSRAVSSLVYKCVTCRKLRGKPQSQKMSDLPEDRTESCPPFTHCGLDCFGPFVVKEGRKEVKRYGMIVTCMTSRAIHIETLDDLSSDVFINALRCVLAIRGPIRTLRCDHGSNFIGAKRELKEALEEIKDEKIRYFLAEQQCDFILNPPCSSHMGGIWERHIRTIRNILTAMIDQHGKRLDTGTLRTFLYEAMAIINSRPLSVQNINDPCGPEPLTPNHLLTMKTKLLMPLPGNFVKEDVYIRRRWRKTQYLMNEFWTKWKKEYLLTQQTRIKWNKITRNIQVGDIVILNDEDHIRGHWTMARVVETFKDADNLVRRVKLLVGTSNFTKEGKRCGKPIVLERPIHKLTVLLESD